MRYLFSLFGRIGRGKFWLGFLISLILSALVGVGAQMLFGQLVTVTNPDGTPVTDLAAVPPDATIAYNMTAMAAYAVASLIPLWVFLATGIKRAHDRNKSGWWLILLMVPSVAATGFMYYRLFQTGFDPDLIISDPMLLGAGAISLIFGLIYLIWWLVDLGILEGTEGANKYGPDPRASSDPMAA